MSWFSWLFRRKEAESELDAELQFHIEEQVDDLVSAGMTPEDARRRAMLSLGGREQIKEEVREARGVAWVGHLAQDLRYGWRMIARSPGLSAAAALSLALGIGANTAIFSLVDAVLLRLLPVREPHELTFLTWKAKRWPAKALRSLHGSIDHNESGASGDAFSYAAFESLRDRARTLRQPIAFVDMDRASATVRGQAETVTCQLVSGDFFQGLGTAPAAGRLLDPGDDRDGAAPAVVISHRYWERRFGGEASAIGSSIAINGAPATVVGVAPRGFFGLKAGESPDFIAPLRMQPALWPEWSRANLSTFQNSQHWWLHVAARRVPGATDEQIRAEVGALLASHPDVVPEDGLHAVVTPAAQGVPALRDHFYKPLRVLAVVVGLVLLIACANVANLLLARAEARRREIVVRLALGAGRGRLVRQLLTESLMLASLGGALGLAFAVWGTEALVAMVPKLEFPIVLDVRPDVRVLAFTAALSILTGLLFGIAPALRATRVDLTPALKENPGRASSSPGPRALGKALVLIQVALSLLLLVGASLFVRSLVKARSIDPGFDPRNLAVFGLDPDQAGYRGRPTDDLYSRIAAKLREIPGVRSVAISRVRPLADQGFVMFINVPGFQARGFKDALVSVNIVSPDFLATIGIPIVAGRGIGPEDTESSRKIAVVNETFVRRFFKGRANAVGGEFSFDARAAADRFEIAGVVRDAKYNLLKGETPPTIFLPWSQHAQHNRRAQFAVRTAGDPAGYFRTVRQAMAVVDRNLPLIDLRTEEQQIGETLMRERLFAKLTGAFAALALALSAVGLYGVLAYSASRRRVEIGIRMALGASRGVVLGSVIREGIALVAAGAAIGLIASRFATKLIETFLYGLTPGDPRAIASAAALLLGTAFVAILIPAWRAARTDPAVALRQE